MNISVTLLTGTARSGTSVLGNIIGSFEDVESFHEPFHFVNLLINNSSTALVDDYIYRELVMASLAGRNVNLNMHDESSMWNYKSKNFIEQRLSRSWTVDMIHETYETVKCLIKNPSFINEFSNFDSNYYPVTKIVIIREPFGNIMSLFKKHWFSDAVINAGNRGEIKKVGGKNFPLWLDDKDVNLFFSLDEMGRCIFYYNRILDKINQNFIKHKFDIMLSYENLCNYSHVTVMNLARKLELLPGELTSKLIEGMKPKRVQKFNVSGRTKLLLEKSVYKYNKLLKFVNV